MNFGIPTAVYLLIFPAVSMVSTIVLVDLIVTIDPSVIIVLVAPVLFPCMGFALSTEKKMTESNVVQSKILLQTSKTFCRGQVVRR